jgi:hypothetical protein
MYLLPTGCVVGGMLLNCETSRSGWHGEALHGLHFGLTANIIAPRICRHREGIVLVSIYKFVEDLRGYKRDMGAWSLIHLCVALLVTNKLVNGAKLHRTSLRGWLRVG